jgi:uncharacterized protein with FMN-binding domain
MKRVLLSITGTVVGVVALLSYKTHGQVATASSGLPSAGLPGASVTSSTPATSTTTTAAPPNPATSTASSAGAPTTSAAGAASASFTGSAVTTRYGVVQVKVTVSGKKITNVAFVQLTAYDDRSQRINSGAAPILLQETLKAQSAQIDSVSGASYTTRGYEQSLQSALDQAGI